MLFLFSLLLFSDSVPIQYRDIPWDSTKEQVSEKVSGSLTKLKVKKRKIQGYIIGESVRFFVTFSFDKDLKLKKVVFFDATKGEVWKPDQVEARFQSILTDFKSRGWEFVEEEPPTKDVSRQYMASDGQGWVRITLEKIPLIGFKQRTNVVFARGTSSKGIF